MDCTIFHQTLNTVEMAAEDKAAAPKISLRSHSLTSEHMTTTVEIGHSQDHVQVHWIVQHL